MKIRDIHNGLNPEVDLTNPDANYEVTLSGRPQDLLKDLDIDLEKEIDLLKRPTTTRLYLEIKKKEFIIYSQNAILNLRKKIGNISVDSYKVSIPKKISLNKIKENIGSIANPNDQWFAFLNKEEKKPQITKKYFQKGKILGSLFRFSKGYSRAFFIIFSLFLLVVLHAFSIRYLVLSSYDTLLSLKDSDNIKYSFEEKITGVNSKLKAAKLLYTPYSYFENQTLKNGSYIIDTGLSASEFILLGKSLGDEIGTKLQNKGIEELSLTTVFSQNTGDIAKVMNGLYSTLIGLQRIENLPDIEKQEQIDRVEKKAKDIYSKIDTVYKNIDTVLAMLGINKEKKYLIVLQNNDEIRPSGGFMGSMGILTIKNGRIENIDFKDVYQLEWNINKNDTTVTPAPEALRGIANELKLRDANYFIDYTQTSNFIHNKLKLIDINLDGIVYINKNIILDFIETTGGIEWNGETITDKNFSEIMSVIVESKISKQGTLGTPKQSLFDFSEVFASELKNDKKYLEYLNIIYKHVKNRDITVHSFIPEENSLLWKLGINGTINTNTYFDFSYPIFTSIGGNKTDRYMELEFDKYIEKTDNCSIKTNLNISRRHSFTQLDETRLTGLLYKYNVADKNKLLEIQGKSDNSSFVRVLLPRNAEILNAEQFKVSNLGDMKMVEFTMITQPLQTNMQNVKYILQNPECREYNYKLFKQPGISKYNIFINKREYKNIKSDFVKDDIF